MITKMFRRMVTGQMMIVAAAVILNEAVSLKTHVCIGGQNNSDETRLEVSVVRSVLLEFILMSDQAQETRKDRSAALSTHCEVTTVILDYSLGYVSDHLSSVDVIRQIRTIMRS